MSKTGTPEAYRNDVDRNIVNYLRSHADSAEAAGKRHWAISMRAAAEKLTAYDNALKIAYCQKIGSDSTHGLDCCDDYRDWLATLTPNVELTGSALLRSPG